MPDHNSHENRGIEHMTWTEPSPEYRAAAVRQLANRAHHATDLALLLDALALNPQEARQ